MDEESDLLQVDEAGKKKRVSRPCRNCSSREHLTVNCLWPCCTFCFKADYKTTGCSAETGCDKRAVLIKHASILDYGRYANLLLLQYENDDDKYGKAVIELKRQHSIYEIMSQEWIECFTSKSLPDYPIGEFTDGNSVQNLTKQQWRQPFKILRPDGLDMHVSNEVVDLDFLTKVKSCKGKLVPVFDLTNKVTYPEMPFNDLLNRWKSGSRNAVLNVLNMQIGPSNGIFKCPKVFNDISWQNAHKKIPIPKKEHNDFLHYLIMSMKGSYTNFHADLSGFSAWMHLVQGQKVWYFVDATPDALEAYEKWIIEDDLEASKTPFILEQIFFNKIRKVVHNAGQTIYVPGGIFHSVWTSSDAIGFGGSFLHSHNIPMQISIHNIDAKHKEDGYFFRNFESLTMNMLWTKFNGCDKVANMTEILSAMDFEDIEALQFIVTNIQTWLHKEKIGQNIESVPEKGETDGVTINKVAHKTYEKLENILVNFIDFYEMVKRKGAKI